MKNFTKVLFAGALMLPALGNAQVSTTPTNRNAVIEEWTGIHCGYCPTGHAAVQTAITNNPGRVIGINIHSGGYATPQAGEPDYRTTAGTTHDNAFGPTGYPSSTLNRRVIGGAQLYHPANSNQADKVPAVLAEASEVNMDLQTSLNVATGALTVDVEYYYTSNSPTATNYLYVAVLQNNVHGPQSDYSLPGNTYNPGAWIEPGVTYNHMHMFRMFLTPQWGDAISSTTAGSTNTMSYSITLPTSINGTPLDFGNIEIAAFINAGSQTTGNILTGVSEHPTLTGFPSANEVISLSSNTDDLLLCDVAAQTISPKTEIKNWGSSNLTSTTISYNINGGTPVVMNWTGNLIPGASTIVTLDPITFTPLAGTNTLNVTLSNPNGSADITSDNATSADFTVDLPTTAATQIVTVNLVTDRYGSETTWDVKNSGGVVIASAGPFGPDLASNGTTTQTPVNVTLNSNECYTFTIYDAYGDGINSGYGAGSFNVKDGNNTVLVSGASFASEDAGKFKTGLLGITELSFQDLTIYPNPASEVLNVSFTTEANDVSISILDLAGRVLATENGSTNVAFPVGHLASGSYLVRISTENGTRTENVVIK